MLILDASIFETHKPLTFGIVRNQFDNITDEIQVKLKCEKNSNFKIFYSQTKLAESSDECRIVEEYGYFIKRLVLTRFNLLCPSIHIQISVFYKRGEYLWIGNVESSEYEKKWFCDVPRAMNQ